MEHNILTLGSEEGLPNLQTHNIEIDIYERLWASGPSGLSCYNGNSIKIYDTRHGLKCSGLRTIKIQNESLLWIGTDRGIELMTIDGDFIQLNFNFDWIYGIAECFYFQDDYIWVGTSYGLLKLQCTDTIVNLVSASDFGLVSQIYSIDKKILALTSKKGLIILKNETVEPFVQRLPNDIQVTCFKETIDHQFLIGTTNGLYITNGTGIINHHYGIAQDSNKVVAIAIINQKWIIAFPNKINTIHQESLDIIELESISIHSSIKYIIGDIYENIWIATNNAGIKKISVLRQAIKKIDCGSNAAVFCNHFSACQKHLYSGGEDFFSVLSKKDEEDIPKLEDYINTKTIVWDVLKDPKDESLMWFATQDGIFKRSHYGDFIKDDAIAKIITVPTRVLLERNTEIYIGTISGLFCIRDGITREVLSKDGSKFGYVYSLSLNQDHNIWVACLGKGLWIETREGFVNLVDNHLVENGNTYCVKTHPSGNTIVLQQENIILLDKDLKSEIIHKEFPLSGWTFDWIDKNNIAVGTDNGLNIINIHKNKFVKKINLYLKKSQWQATSSRSLICYSNNKLYYGQISGLYAIDLNVIEKRQAPPIVHLNRCNWINAQPKLENNTYTLPYGKWIVKFDVFSTWYLDERHISFRFKLAGFDEDWTELRRQSSKSYNSLPKGNYEFFVQAHTPLTGFGKVTSLIEIHVTKPVTSFSNAINKFRSTLKIENASALKNKLLLKQNELFKKEIQERAHLESVFESYNNQLENLVLQRTKELKTEKEKAEFTNNQKSIFLDTMSQEIKTPLNRLINLVDLLYDTSINQTQKEYIQKIDNTSKYLLEVVNNVLDITKIESGQIELHLAPFSLIKLLDDLAEFARIKTEKKPIEFIIDKSIETKHLIIGDVIRIKQVLINLIENALKFTETGPIILKINELKTSSDQAVFKFIIEGTGIDITKNQLEKLFIAFEQGDKNTARKYGSFGLALNISHNYINLMGGLLIAASEPNKATSISFTLAFDKDVQLDQRF